MENLANTGLGDNLSSGSLLIQQIIYMIRWKNLYLSQLLKLNSSFYLCTQTTASTMLDFSISMAMVVTIPVHCAPATEGRTQMLHSFQEEF